MAGLLLPLLLLVPLVPLPPLLPLVPLPLLPSLPPLVPLLSLPSLPPLLPLVPLLSLLSLVPLAPLAGAAAPPCPRRCVCQAPAPSFAVLCSRTGLLFVPPALDRRTAELRLGDNFITALRAADFANMSSLIHLTLSRNAISHIAPRAFLDLKGLHALHLDSNRLTSINEEHFKGLVNLRHLILSNNQLSSIAPGALDDFLETIEDLDLSYNNLADLPWAALGRLANVNTLSLDHNLIELVPQGVFSALHKLARLDVTSNKLKKIPPDPLFSRLPVYARPKGSPPRALVLGFGGNPLHCNCELLWLRRLARGDDLETCASPPRLAGRYFWSVEEEEFACEPPVITHRTARLAAAAGRGAALKCKAVGDPEPLVRWIGPDGRLVGNTSRAVSYANGTLELRAAAPADAGTFTCIAANAAGEAAAPVELLVTPPPGLANSTGCAEEAEPGASDILIPAKSSVPNDTKAEAVTVAEVTATSALVRWPAPPPHGPGVRVLQVQYNSSADDVLVYRMIPAGSKSFFLTDLAAGRAYDLCVLAVLEAPAAPAAPVTPVTRVLGCARFATLEAARHCRSLHAHFLGGTMILIIGGVIVASVLVFIALLLLKYKAHNGRHKGTERAKLSSACSQTNGAARPHERRQGAKDRAGLDVEGDPGAAAGLAMEPAS